MQVNCFAALGVKEKLQPFKYTPSPLSPEDVEVQISHCGVCHSDIHLVDNDWKNSQYPLVPGHEIIGTIKKVGERVKNLSVGQRVGIGWLSNSCGHCEWCLSGRENQCKEQAPTCMRRFGGFSDSIIVNHRFAFEIPKALSSEDAAPLMCGGITVYSPLKEYLIKPKMRVGIIGIGGLGHLALQFAHALGCDVTAFTSSQVKNHDAIKFGADKVVSSTDSKALALLANSFDLILSTATGNLDWQAFIFALRPFGKLCFVGVPSLEVPIPLLALIAGKKTVCGSNIGSCAEIREMLEFASLHNVRPQIEVLDFKECNMALDKVRKNDAHYRIVLSNEKSS